MKIADSARCAASAEKPFGLRDREYSEIFPKCQKIFHKRNPGRTEAPAAENRGAGAYGIRGAPLRRGFRSFRGFASCFPNAEVSTSGLSMSWEWPRRMGALFAGDDGRRFFDCGVI